MKNAATTLPPGLAPMRRADASLDLDRVKSLATEGSERFGSTPENNDGLRGQVAHLYNIIREEVYQSRDLVDRKKELEKELFALRAETENLHDAIARLEREMRLGKQQRTWYERHHEFLRVELLERQKALQKTQEMLETERKTLENELYSEIQKTVNNSRVVDDLESVRYELEQQTSNLELVRKQLKAKDGTERLELAERQYSKTLSSLKDSERRAQVAKREVESVKNQMKAQETIKLQTLEILRTKEEEIRTLEKETQTLKRKLAEFCRPHIDPKIEAQWKKLLDLADQRVSWTEEKLVLTIKTSKSLEKNMRSFQLKYNELFRKSETMRHVKRRLEQKVVDTEKNCEIAVVQRDKLKQEYQRHKSALEQLRAKQKALTDERDLLKTQNTEQKKRIHDLEKKQAKLDAKTADGGGIPSLKLTLPPVGGDPKQRRLQELVKTQSKSIHDLKADKTKLRAENRNLKDQLSRLTDGQKTVKTKSERTSKRRKSPLHAPENTKKSSRKRSMNDDSKLPPKKRQHLDVPKTKSPKPASPNKPKTRATSVRSHNNTKNSKKRSLPDDHEPRPNKPKGKEHSAEVKEDYEPDSHKWFGSPIHTSGNRTCYASLTLHDNPSKCTSVGDTIQIRWKQHPNLEFGDIESLWELNTNKGKQFSVRRAYVKPTSTKLGRSQKFGRNELFQVPVHEDWKAVWCRYIIRSTFVWFPPTSLELGDIEKRTSGREQFFCRFQYDAETNSISRTKNVDTTETPPWHYSGMPPLKLAGS